MAELDPNWKYEHHHIFASYNDYPIKQHTVDTAMEVLGFEVEFHPHPKGPDLRAKHDHSIVIEVERAWVIGNYWKSEYHKYLSNLGYATVNMPHRKEKYYLKYYNFYGERIDNRDKYNKVIFIRWNWDGSQANIIYANVVLEGKWERSLFIPKNNQDDAADNKGPEKWLCFAKEVTVVKNEQLNGKYIEDTLPGGEYVPRTEDQITKQQEEIQLEKIRIQKEKQDRAIARAKEIRQQQKENNELQRSVH